MPPENYFGPDFPTKQSAGYMFVRLLCVQLIFIIIDAVLVFAGDASTSVTTFPGLYISPIDVLLIQIGLMFNFAIFILIFALWQSTEYRISNSHLHIEHGIFNYTTESIIDLAIVEGVSVRDNWLGALFNYGTIEIYLDKAHKNRRIRLPGVPYPYQFMAYFNAQLTLPKRNVTHL